jgi:hypothetical protein
MTTYLLLLVLLVLLPLSVIYADRLRAALDDRWGSSISPAAFPLAAIALLFSGLVATGISGSSLGLLLSDRGIVDTTPNKILGAYRPVRGDEWLVITGYAVAQANHSPPFPVINGNLGEDGQNMLITHMTGAPVWHLSALAKPATWGFFLFDLKRALAWFWWLPLFFCGLALWWVFQLLLPGRWRLSLALSLWFCASPYITGWSLWPAYAVAFPALGFCAFISLLKADNLRASILWGLLLGLSLAGFVLVLYPPWQVSVGTLFLLLALGIATRDRLFANAKLLSLPGLILAVLVAALLLSAWWIDARDAIAAMMNTVYPGQRTTLTGAGFTLEGLFRGIINLDTLYSGASNRSVWFGNASETASFVYYLGPLLLVAAVAIATTNRQRAALIMVSLFVLWVLVYQFFGMPEWLTRSTLWGRVPIKRAELALGLAQVILVALLATANSKPLFANPRLATITSALIAACWAALAFTTLQNAAEEQIVSTTAWIVTTLLLFCGTYLLLAGRIRSFILLNLVWSAVASSAFNPLVSMPERITANGPVSRLLSVAEDDLGHPPRVLVVDAHHASMRLFASGVAVSSGIFFYPPQSFWQRLDSDDQLQRFYNRYQHLYVNLQATDARSGFTVENPLPDVVRLQLDPLCFDFTRSGADIVLARSRQSSLLRQNPSLGIIGEVSEWTWFRIQPANQDSTTTGMHCKATQAWHRIGEVLIKNGLSNCQHKPRWQHGRVLAHANCTLPMTVSPGDEFTIDFGIFDGAWKQGKTNGVGFEVLARDRAGEQRLLHRRVLRPSSDAADRSRSHVEITVPADVEELLLITEQLGDGSWDWSFWGPIVKRSSSPE